MYYLLVAAGFLITLYVVTRLLKSVFKGCFTALVLVFVAVIGYILYISNTAPVEILDLYKVDQMEIKKL